MAVPELYSRQETNTSKSCSPGSVSHVSKVANPRWGRGNPQFPVSGQSEAQGTRHSPGRLKWRGSRGTEPPLGGSGRTLGIAVSAEWNHRAPQSMSCLHRGWLVWKSHTFGVRSVVLEIEAIIAVGTVFF